MWRVSALPRARWKWSAPDPVETSGTCATRGPSGVSAKTMPKPISSLSDSSRARSSMRKSALGCITSSSLLGEGDRDPQGRGGGARAEMRLLAASGHCEGAPPPCFAWSPSPFRGGSFLPARRLAPRCAEGARAPFAAASLAVGLGVGLGGLLLLGLVGRGRAFLGFGLAGALVETELLHAGG